MLTLKKINQSIRELGHSEELVKGNGYYYFTKGDTASRYETAVYVNSLNSLTLDMWLDEYERLSSSRKESGYGYGEGLINFKW